MLSLRTIPLISVIADDRPIARAVARFVESAGFAVETFASAGEFISSSHLEDTACVIIDADLPGMSGLQLQSQLASSSRHIPIIFIIVSLDGTARERALEVGAVDFLRKPFGEKALLKEIRSALKPGDPPR